MVSFHILYVFSEEYVKESDEDLDEEDLEDNGFASRNLFKWHLELKHRFLDSLSVVESCSKITCKLLVRKMTEAWGGVTS